MTIKPGAWPEGAPDDVKEFMEHFCHYSNASSTHNDHEGDEEHFAELFTEDGVFEFAGKEVKGRAAIQQARHAMFKDIPHREHPVVKFYPFGTNYMDLMALSEVSHKHHSGVKHEKLSAHRYLLKKVGNEIKVEFCGVIMDPSRPKNA